MGTLDKTTVDHTVFQQYQLEAIPVSKSIIATDLNNYKTVNTVIHTLNNEDRL